MRKRHTRLKQLQARVCQSLVCPQCPGVVFSSLSQYDKHMIARRHVWRVLKTSLPWRCGPCAQSYSSQTDWLKHLTGLRHHRTLVRAYQTQKDPTRPPYTSTEACVLNAGDAEELEDVEWLVNEREC